MSFAAALTTRSSGGPVVDIKVLGTGCCGSCNSAYALIEQTAAATGRQVTLSKVQELREIMAHGVMSTPAIVIDGKVVHAGSVPSRQQVQEWLARE
jgi:small redox-active disulfide protein 2